jgi:hypothetical protein
MEVGNPGGVLKKLHFAESKNILKETKQSTLYKQQK